MSEITISLPDTGPAGDRDETALFDLKRRLTAEDDARGGCVWSRSRPRRHPRRPGGRAMLLVEPGALAVLASVLVTWLRGRRSTVRLEIRRGDGKGCPSPRTGSPDSTVSGCAVSSKRSRTPSRPPRAARRPSSGPAGTPRTPSTARRAPAGDRLDGAGTHRRAEGARHGREAGGPRGRACSSSARGGTTSGRTCRMWRRSPRTLVDLREMYVERCGLPRSAVTVGTTPRTSEAFGQAVAEAAESAEGLLLVHYVGHGLVAEDGTLHPWPPPARSAGGPGPLHRAAVRRAAGLASPAARPGPGSWCWTAATPGSRWPRGPSGRTVPIAVTGLARIAGSAGPDGDRRQHARPGPAGRAPHRVQRRAAGAADHGPARGPPVFTLDEVHRQLVLSLTAAGLPKPRRALSGDLGDWSSPTTRPGPPPRPPPRRTPAGPGPRSPGRTALQGAGRVARRTTSGCSSGGTGW
ncbi:hypothetical protein LT493_32035 [Streptomyces tricolor]|nr:hypothetical protein [Streptomyces tricolor]